MIPSMYSAAKGFVGAAPTLDAMGTLGQRYRVYMSGSDTQKRVGKMLFDDREQGASSRELNSLAALTFNVSQNDEIVEMLGLALQPEQATWRTMLKGLRLAETIVTHGSETGVNSMLDFDRAVQRLTTYNSATASRLHGLRGGGQDEGGPVRAAATSLAALLGDMERIRELRLAARDPNTLVPMGADDYTSAAALASQGATPDRGTFGQVTQDALGAKFTLENIPGLYEGRPDRYFEDPNDPRGRGGAVEDASHTRNALAGDLLDLDFAPTSSLGGALPAPDFLPAQQQNEQLQAQLAQMQAQLASLSTQGAAAPAPPAPPQAPIGGTQSMASPGAVGQPQMGQPQMGQPQMGQPQMGQQPGQPQMNQQQMGQQQMGYPQMGQQQMNYPPMAQQQMGYPHMGYAQSHQAQPQMGYGQPQMGYGQPQMGYGQQQMGYGQQQMGYGQQMGHVPVQGGQRDQGQSGQPMNGNVRQGGVPTPGAMDPQTQLQMLQAQQRALQQRLAQAQGRGLAAQNGYAS